MITAPINERDALGVVVGHALSDEQYARLRESLSNKQRERITRLVNGLGALYVMLGGAADAGKP